MRCCLSVPYRRTTQSHAYRRSALRSYCHGPETSSGAFPLQSSLWTRTDANPWGTAGREIRAHEFHYASLDGLPDGLTWARKITRGHGTDGVRDAIVKGNTVAGFIHLRSTGQVPWVPGFLSFVRRVVAQRKQSLK